MVKEMPRRYWKHMPETVLIPALTVPGEGPDDARVSASPARRCGLIGREGPSEALITP